MSKYGKTIKYIGIAVAAYFIIRVVMIYIGFSIGSGDQFFPPPGKPKIKYGEFPFTLI